MLGVRGGGDDRGMENVPAFRGSMEIIFFFDGWSWKRDSCWECWWCTMFRREVCPFLGCLGSKDCFGVRGGG